MKKVEQNYKECKITNTKECLINNEIVIKENGNYLILMKKKMMNYFIKKILIFFDYFHKKKIINKLKKICSDRNLKVILDVGAHEGESIELFLKNFKVNNIYSFEPSKDTFKILMENSDEMKKKFSKTNIYLENFAVGDKNEDVQLNCLNETSSSTLRDLNTDSNYFKKKEKYFGKLINEKITVKQINFKEYLEKKIKRN